jgi:uncharacterized membrane protein YphA (DoxX/SURF4 family)
MTFILRIILGAWFVCFCLDLFLLLYTSKRMYDSGANCQHRILLLTLMVIVSLSGPLLLIGLEIYGKRNPTSLDIFV